MNQRSQFTQLASASAVVCLCIQKSGTMCEKCGMFNSSSVPTYRTSTITKKAYRTNVRYPYHYKKGVPYFLAKIEAYRTVPTYHTAILAIKYVCTRSKLNKTGFKTLKFRMLSRRIICSSLPNVLLLMDVL